MVKKDKIKPRKVIHPEKLSKKARKAYNAEQRNTWGALNPITRIVPNGKAYDRGRAKKEARLAAYA